MSKGINLPYASRSDASIFSERQSEARSEARSA
jgi:hypothetical protein